MIARINFARKVRCHSGTVEIVERAAVPSSGRGSSRSGRSRETAGEAWVRGAQLCKTGKAGAASFADVRARNIKDGPAPRIRGVNCGQTCRVGRNPAACPASRAAGSGCANHNLLIIIARLLSSEPWSLERCQVYSLVRSRHGYLISPFYS
jgi:hypothetical protein